MKLISKLVRALRKALRQRNADIVRVYCQSCWEMHSPFEEHDCR
jgi:hypothetical protein